MKINILLPYKERFDANRASSVSITVRNNLLHSKYLDKIKVFGQNVETPLFKDNFVGLTYPFLSFKGKNKFLLHEMLKIINKDSDKKQLLEIHNRPYLIKQISKQNKFPITLFFHNDPQKMKGSKSIKDREKILEKCAAIFCVSKFIKKKFIQGINGDKNKVHILYNGVERKTVSFPTKNKEILFVGRIVPEKGVHFYVEALELVANKHPEWKFGLIGSIRLGDNDNTNIYASEVINKFKSIGSQAQFYGYQDNRFVQKKMKEASIIVIPSVWQEPFGLVAAEAMSNGVCIIASKVGGLPEIIKNNGILINNINHKKLSSKINVLIKDNCMRENYQRRAWNKFELFSYISSQKLDHFREVIFSNSV